MANGRLNRADPDSKVSPDFGKFAVTGQVTAPGEVADIFDVLAEFGEFRATFVVTLRPTFDFIKCPHLYVNMYFV